jgi:hypothetical protein
MKFKSFLFLSLFFIFASVLTLGAQTPPDTSSEAATILIDKIIDSAIKQERDLSRRMVTLTPLIETYTQNMAEHPDLGAVPKSDKYFLGKLDLSKGIHQKSLLPSTSGWLNTVGQLLKQTYSITFIPDGFAESIMLGQGLLSKYASVT